jgi:hypothetical protein
MGQHTLAYSDVGNFSKWIPNLVQALVHQAFYLSILFILPFILYLFIQWGTVHFTVLEVVMAILRYYPSISLERDKRHKQSVRIPSVVTQIWTTHFLIYVRSIIAWIYFTAHLFAFLVDCIKIKGTVKHLPVKTNAFYTVCKAGWQDDWWIRWKGNDRKDLWYVWRYNPCIIL